MQADACWRRHFRLPASHGAPLAVACRPSGQMVCDEVSLCVIALTLRPRHERQRMVVAEEVYFHSLLSFACGLIGMLNFPLLQPTVRMSKSATLGIRQRGSWRRRRPRFCRDSLEDLGITHLPCQKRMKRAMASSRRKSPLGRKKEG